MTKAHTVLIAVTFSLVLSRKVGFIILMLTQLQLQGADMMFRKARYVRHFGLHWTTTTCTDLCIHLIILCKSNRGAFILAYSYMLQKHNKKTQHFMFIIGVYWRLKLRYTLQLANNSSATCNLRSLILPTMLSSVSV